MRQGMTMAVALACSVTTVAPGPAEAPVEERIVIKEVDETYRLSVPVSRLIMIIPRGGLTVVQDSGNGGTANPRYFHFADSARGVIVSGWFEPASMYRGIQQLWKGEADSWRKNELPKPKNESFVKIEKWDAVLYDYKAPGGSNTHIRAEWAELDTWIDVHISVTTAEPISAARATAMDVLRGIQVVPSQ